MLQLRDINKRYVTGELVQTALDNVSLNLRDSEFVAILGPSGSGKTTLLNVIGGLDRYDSGDLIINGVSTKEYTDRDWDSYRNHTVGFVFQSYNLIPHQSILSNVELALTISGISRAERRERAQHALDQVGLGDQAHKKPNQMSGGQMQRVAIARALVNDPDILLADEPTGALDSETSIQVMDLLKEVAKDKLVVMVTHNPELAEEYASRIVRLRDGRITDDSQPYVLGEDELTEGEHKNMGRARMSFTAALSLSFNNLRTKKGRTALTAFAGAIGIIGIALILSLSSGMNDYISQLEADTMGTYPIELEKETIDLTSVTGQGGMAGESEGSSAEDGSIASSNIVAESVEASESLTTENNLGAFKKYLDANSGQLDNSLAAVEYGYDVVPQVYRQTTANEEGLEEDVVQVSPSSLDSDNTTTTTGMSAMSGMSGMSSMVSGSTSSAWSELVDDEDLRNSQYSLVAGSWPEEANEVALVVDENGLVSDYTLYTLGLLSMEDMNNLVDAVENGEEYSDEQASFTYDQVLGLEYQVFSPSALYEYDSDAGAWADMSEDADYISELYSSGTGTTVKVTAILQAGEDADVSSGVVYTKALTTLLMEQSAASEVVQAQLADPATNVLTGEAFDDENEEDSDSSSESSSSEMDASAVSYESTGSASSGTKNTAYETAEYNVETSESLAATADYQVASASASVVTVASEETSEGSEEGGSETETATYTVRFLNYDGSVLTTVQSYTEGDAVTNAPEENPTRASDATYTYTFLGWKSSTTNSVYTLIEDIPAVTESVDYTAFYYAAPVSASSQGTGSGGASSLINSGSSGISSSDLSALMGSSSSNDLSSLLGSSSAYSSVDLSAITSSYASSLSSSQLAVLMAQMSNDTPSTYEDVLSALGYASEDEPTSIALYPTDFDGKSTIEDFIEQYNNQVENETDKVTYTDLVATMTSAITSVVDIVSAILVAFTSISLVVSSIMIAIITYISVLERTKEIGILRAIGASKNDVSKIFNAETVIEGLASGVFGIVVTLLLNIPINAIISSMFGVDGIASLPMQYCLILIAISVVLTLIAGWVPSRIAAKKDPVEALRSE